LPLVGAVPVLAAPAGLLLGVTCSENAYLGKACPWRWVQLTKSTGRHRGR